MKIILGCGQLASSDGVSTSLSLNTGFKGTSANSAEQTEAFSMLQDLMNDPEFATAGRRNNDAVNFCIALHVLGYEPVEWFDALNEIADFHANDYFEFKECVTRVSDYLEAWGPTEDRGAALKKAIKF